MGDEPTLISSPGGNEPSQHLTALTPWVDGSVIFIFIYLFFLFFFKKRRKEVKNGEMMDFVVCILIRIS